MKNKADIAGLREGQNTGKYRVEKNFYRGLKVLAIADGNMVEIIDCRLYRTQARTYCALWIRDAKNNRYRSGGDFAGGYGYHRPSAAISGAIADAGITLEHNIEGVGESAIEGALTAIAEALGGYNKITIISIYG